MAMSLILIHKDLQPGSVDYLDALVDPRSSQVPSTASKCQFTLPDIMLYLLQLLILPFQLLLVDLVAFDFRHHALVVKVVYCAVDLGAEVMVIFEELELAQGISAEGSGRWEWGGLEGLDVLMRVPVDHAVHQGVFTILELDILGRFHFAAREPDVEGDVVRTFVQCVPFRDLQLWPIILPSSPWVNLRPFVG